MIVSAILMHDKVFGGRAESEPARGAQSAPLDPIAGFTGWGLSEG